jgi:ferredoxin--NADP+ reductase
MFGRPLRVAIIGAGPAGFYAAEHLQKRAPEGAEIDMYDRLATPYGLVRGGVAPDHQKIKSVTKIYERIAAQPGFRYYGLVELGRDVTIDELRHHYDAVLVSVGAPNDRTIGIPGEALAGSLSATAFVAWYNGHPDAVGLDVDLSVSDVVVVGNGNVAVDVARILVTSPDVLASTDIADHALAALRTSAVRTVTMLGRRGPAQAAFTSKELRELGELDGVTLVVDPADLEAAADLAGDDEDARRVLDALGQVAGRTPTSGDRVINLRFLTSPSAIVGAQRVEAVHTVANALVADGGGTLRAVATDQTDQIPAGMVLRAVGYLGAPVPGLPFDERRGTIPNDHGRVLESPEGAPLGGVYVAGWIKRGPQGVIGTNKADAGESVDALLGDLAGGGLSPAAEPSAAAIDTLIRARVTPIGWEDWLAIDQAEREAGATQGRPRVKVVDAAAMRAIAKDRDAR